jgi:hypothetical protein
MWGLFEKKGSWFNTDTDLLDHIKSKNLEMPEKIQGMKNIYALLEGDKELYLCLKDYVITNLLSE